MNEREQGATTRAAFDRAFVATSFALERRGSELLAPLDAPAPAAVELLRRLGQPERQNRAQALAAELGRIAAALESRSLR